MAIWRILVVEDEAIIAKDIQSKLVLKGYDVPDIAISGEEALEKVVALKPDLVLMDIRLQGPMDGVDTAEQIRTRFHLPVVYLTAYMDDTTVQRAKLTQPFGYLLKPFQENELHTAIEIALYRHEMEQRLATAYRQLESRVRELEARDHMVQLQMSGPTLEQTWQEILQTIAQALAVPQLHLFWPGPDGRNLVLVASQASAPPPAGPQQELADRAFQEGRLQCSPDRREVAAPILYRDLVLGVLWVQDLRGEAEAQDEAIQVLKRLAQQAALVLRMAQMSEDLDSGKIQVADLLELEKEEGDEPA